MKERIKSSFRHIMFHAETIIAIPLAIFALLAISLVVSWAIGNPLTENIQSVVAYGIKAVGFVLASGVAIAIKSRGFGDVDEKTCDWRVLLIDSCSLWITLILALLAVFGATLWL